MSNITSTLMAGVLSAVLFAAPAISAEGKPGGGGGGGGKAMSGGGGGGKAMSGGGGRSMGGGGAAGIRSKSGSGGGGGGKVFSGNPGRTSGSVVRAPRNDGGNVTIRNKSVSRDRNVIVRGDRGGRDRGARHRGTRYLWGGLPFYFYDGYYHGDCGWLRRRAEATGSRYWWIRYRQCREE